MSLPGPTGLLFALLLAGHCLGDFVLQTDRMAAGKHRLRFLLRHVSVVVASHAVLLAPFASARSFVLLLIVGSSHALVDRGSAAVVRRRRGARPLVLFVDQALHLAVLGWGAIWLGRLAPAETLWQLPLSWWPLATTAAIGISAYAFNWHGASSIVMVVLERFSDYPDAEAESQSESESEPENDADRRAQAEARRGRAIGILERMFLLTLVLLDQWGALGLTLAFKSIARFKDLDDRRFSESYLIGTLASLLIAMASGLAVKLFL